MDSPCGIGVKYTMRVSEDVPATQFFAAEKAAILGLPPGLPPTKVCGRKCVMVSSRIESGSDKCLFFVDYFIDIFLF